MSTPAIDKPFCFTWGFILFWACLLPPAFFAVKRLDLGPWYSQTAFLLVVPFLFTFVLYGPILFVRAVLDSGPRGWKVLGVLGVVLLAALVFFGVLLLSGIYTESRAGLLGGVFTAVAAVYVKLRLRPTESAEPGASANGGPSIPPGNSGVGGGPPPVSQALGRP